MAKKAATKYIKLEQNKEETRLFKKGSRYMAEERVKDYGDEDEGWVTVGVFTKENLNTLVRALKQAQALRKLVDGLDGEGFDLLDVHVDDLRQAIFDDKIPLSDCIDDFEVIIYDGGDKVGIGCKTITAKELGAILKL